MSSLFGCYWFSIIMCRVVVQTVVGSYYMGNETLPPMPNIHYVWSHHSNANGKNPSECELSKGHGQSDNSSGGSWNCNIWSPIAGADPTACVGPLGAYGAGWTAGWGLMSIKMALPFGGGGATGRLTKRELRMYPSIRSTCDLRRSLAPAARWSPVSRRCRRSAISSLCSSAIILCIVGRCWNLTIMYELAGMMHQIGCLPSLIPEYSRFRRDDGAYGGQYIVDFVVAWGSYQRRANRFQVLNRNLWKYTEKFTRYIAFSVDADFFRRQQNHTKEL